MAGSTAKQFFRNISAGPFVNEPTMKKTFILVLAAAAVIGAGGFTAIKVHAGVQKPRAGFRGPVMQKIIDGLQLTDEQVDKMKSEIRGEKETLVPLLKQLHETRKGLRDVIQSGSDEAAIRAAAAKVAAVEADLAVERAKLHTKIAPILTDEQILKVKAFEEKVDDFVIKALKTFGENLEQE